MTRQLRHQSVLAGAGMALMCAVLSFAAAPRAAADDAETAASKGAVIAETWCAACHRVPGGLEPTMSVGAPSFVEILRDPARDAGYLYDAVTGDHDVMTTAGLGRDELEEVVLYMLDLRDTLAVE